MNIPTREKLSAFSPHAKGKVKACIPQYNTGWMLADSGIKQAPPSLGSQDEYSQPASTLASLAGGGNEDVTREEIFVSQHHVHQPPPSGVLSHRKPPSSSRCTNRPRSERSLNASVQKGFALQNNLLLCYPTPHYIPACIARIFSYCLYTSPPKGEKMKKTKRYLPQRLGLEGVGSPFVIHSQQRGSI